eukprot:6184508-Pleurochrysis_carterae.AAC.1
MRSTRMPCAKSGECSRRYRDVAANEGQAPSRWSAGLDRRLLRRASANAAAESDANDGGQVWQVACH